MSNHKWVVVQIHIDVLHNVRNGVIQSHKPLIVHIGEDGDVKIVILTRSMRVGREHIHLNPVVDLLQRAGQFFEGIRFGGGLRGGGVMR